MTLLKPTTSQLMAALHEWPIMPASAMQGTAVFEWQAKHVPWVWTPDEFRMQTQMLMANDCTPRDMLAWLVNGVRWGEPGKTNASLQALETQIELWQSKGAYLRAWIEGTQGRIDDEVVRTTCGRIDWHPVWRNTNFANVVDDFAWARDVRAMPDKVRASRKSLSSFGSLELAHATSDHEFRFACAVFIAKKMQASGMAAAVAGPTSGTRELLQCALLDQLSPFVQRALIVACAQNGDAKLLEPGLVERVHTIWSNGVPTDEQAWWHDKARVLSFESSTSAMLLEQGIHPLELIHRDRAQDLTLFKELAPEAFRSGFALKSLLAQNNTVSLNLPELHMDIDGGMAP